MICKDCGNSERFIQDHFIEEAALYDGEGEFVKTLHAETKDTSKFRCYVCEEENISETEGTDT